MNKEQHEDERNDPADVQKKLAALEHDLDSQKNTELPLPVSTQDLIRIPDSAPMADDLYYLAGLGLIVFAVLIFFQHIHVGTGLLQAFGLGLGGFCLLIIPLLAGIGFIVYDRTNKLGYALIAISTALIFFSVLSSLIMTFAPISLMGLIIMLTPLAVGSAFMVRGMGGRKGIEYKLRQQGLLKRRLDLSNERSEKKDK